MLNTLRNVNLRMWASCLVSIGVISWWTRWEWEQLVHDKTVSRMAGLSSLKALTFKPIPSKENCPPFPVKMPLIFDSKLIPSIWLSEIMVVAFWVVISLQFSFLTSKFCGFSLFWFSNSRNLGAFYWLVQFEFDF